MADQVSALVLQGGGALGAFQYGGLKALTEKTDFRPAIVTGVSIGAINAAVYVGGKYGPIESLRRLWETVTMEPNPYLPQAWQAKASKLGNPAMYWLNPWFFAAPLTAQSLCTLEPFKALLNELIDLEKLNNSSTQVVLEAVNVETGLMERFCNFGGQQLSIEKIIASMSIPPNFPAAHVGMDYYWDGGLYANMPLSPAINFLEEQGSESTERQLVVMTLFRRAAKLPENLEEISERIKELMFESKIELDEKFFHKVNAEIEFFQKLDQELPANSPLRQEKVFQQMKAHRPINRYAVLRYRGEGVAGTDDFTPNAVRGRIRDGYRQAETAISEHKIR